MTGNSETIRLTVAQAIVRYLMNQFIEIDGVETRICGGGFGIFGHGNVPCLGEALYPVRDEMPLYRGQNEQSMGFAAAAYAKYHLRRRFMFCTASAGPGTANLLTASALAHANRLPMLMLCGDTFLTRLPDPVLQQLEHFGNPALGLNDAFKAVTRYWDRITHPAQVIQTLPAALATMLDPADCGPAFLALPQDVQGWAYDYPASFFARRAHRIRRQAPDAAEITDAAALLKSAERPDDHRGRRSPVFRRGGGNDGLRRGAWHPGGRDDRRPRQHVGDPSAEHRPRRRHRLGQRERHRRTGGRRAGRGHAAAGFHHRILDRLRIGRAAHRAERGTP
jgi:3D-(3,5/4)-trihydroxycyclohexane-1,2-dione acylhydrolase (decyclizing)